MRPPDREESPIETSENETVATSVHCRRCGYDIRGLSTQGQCPECGLEVLSTLTLIVDPATSRLPTLNDPRGVGNGLLGLSCTALVAALLLALPGAVHATRIAEPGFQIQPAALRSVLAASVVGASGLGWMYLLARSPADAPAAMANRDLRRLVTGLVLWVLSLFGCALLLATTTLPIEAVQLLPIITVPFALLTLIGLRSILELVGLRSRAYRNARGGRQSINGLIAAIVAVVAGLLAELLGSTAGLPWLTTVGVSVALASTLLLLIGLVYLVVNCWWIRAALRSPPPRMHQLVRVDSAP